MLFGLEIEFITDREKLFNALKENQIDFMYSDRMRTDKQDCIVLKPENTLKDPNGIEINFPPSEDFKLVRKVLDIFKNLEISFNQRCALHVHVDFRDRNQEDLQKVFNYYLENQEKIIKEVDEKGLYLNLNKPLTKEKGLRLLKASNLNILYSYCCHKTVEHRIFKATTDYEEVVYCVEKTIDIVKRALKQ